MLLTGLTTIFDLQFNELYWGFFTNNIIFASNSIIKNVALNILKVFASNNIIKNFYSHMAQRKMIFDNDRSRIVSKVDLRLTIKQISDALQQGCET